MENCARFCGKLSAKMQYISLFTEFGESVFGRRKSQTFFGPGGDGPVYFFGGAPDPSNRALFYTSRRLKKNPCQAVPVGDGRSHLPTHTYTTRLIIDLQKMLLVCNQLGRCKKCSYYLNGGPHSLH